MFKGATRALDRLSISSWPELKDAIGKVIWTGTDACGEEEQRSEDGGLVGRCTLAGTCSKHLADEVCSKARWLVNGTHEVGIDGRCRNPSFFLSSARCKSPRFVSSAGSCSGVVIIMMMSRLGVRNDKMTTRASLPRMQSRRRDKRRGTYPA